MPLQELIFIDDAEAVPRALETLEHLDVVGVDVERADSNRYYRAAALIQVGGEGRVTVIDPLALADFTALDAFLATRTTVLHAMENDLPPLTAIGIKLARVEDTAIAAALLGLPTGLEGLLADVLDVTVTSDKQAMQRADWEARPLAEEMLAYAAGDVADLPRLWEWLSVQLLERGREDWYRQEVAALLAQPSTEERRNWSRTKGSGRLDPQAKVRLRHLWETRERLARSTNTAPGRIAADKVLVDLATTPPTRTTELGRRGMRRQAIRTFGDELLAAIVEAGRAEPESAERARKTRGPTPEQRALADELRTLRAARARELGIDPGVLCPGRTLASAVAAEPSTPEDLRSALGLRPWQWEQVGGAFCEALELAGSGKPATTTQTDQEDERD